MIDLSGRVAIVTGAGAGLGRAHALLLAKRGARVVVNDLGDGAHAVAEEIELAGGEALAAQNSVTDFEAVQAMVEAAKARWGRVDILVANAGIIRDKSFAKMNLDDFRLVVDVHLMGTVNCVKAVWETMREQNYGRIVLTTSSSGLYGNFGQTNYSAAKMALVGFMQTLGLEGAPKNIKINCIAPTAATAMLDGVFPEEMMQRLRPDQVSPAVLALVRDEAPNRTIVCAGGGSFEIARITYTQGIYVGEGENPAEELIARWEDLIDPAGERALDDGLAQSAHELSKAQASLVHSEGAVQ
ncbi:SDR family NAD(P)-dependent oxidoreductase [Sphingobium ummariense]